MKELEALSAAISKLQDDTKKAEAGRINAIESLIAEVSAALSELVEIAQKRETADLGPVVDAIRSIKVEIPKAADVLVEVSPTPVKIENKVNVSPTPVSVHNIIPPAVAPEVNITSGAPIGAKWEIRQPGSYGQPDRVTFVKRIA